MHSRRRRKKSVFVMLTLNTYLLSLYARFSILLVPSIFVRLFGDRWRCYSYRRNGTLLHGMLKKGYLV